MKAINGLAYVSDANLFFSKIDIIKLAMDFNIKNKELGITGYLSYDADRFVQYIEGEGDSAMRLMNSIKNDKRHNVLAVVTAPPLADRIFPEWNMRYISQEEIVQFNLELFIENNLLCIQNNLDHKDRCRKELWKQIKAIAASYDNLPLGEPETPPT